MGIVSRSSWFDVVGGRAARHARTQGGEIRENSSFAPQLYCGRRRREGASKCAEPSLGEVGEGSGWGEGLYPSGNPCPNAYFNTVHSKLG